MANILRTFPYLSTSLAGFHCSKLLAIKQLRNGAPVLIALVPDVHWWPHRRCSKRKTGLHGHVTNCKCSKENTLQPEIFRLQSASSLHCLYNVPGAQIHQATCKRATTFDCVTNREQQISELTSAVLIEVLESLEVVMRRPCSHRAHCGASISTKHISRLPRCPRPCTANSQKPDSSTSSGASRRASLAAMLSLATQCSLPNV